MASEGRQHDVRREHGHGPMYVHVDQAGSATDDAALAVKAGWVQLPGSWCCRIPSIVTFLLLVTLLDFTHSDLFFPSLRLQGLVEWREERLVVVL